MRIYSKFLPYVFILFLLNGCTVNKRGLLNDHTYFSNRSPNIQIEIAPSFKKIDRQEGGQGYSYRHMEKNRLLRFKHFIGAVNENNIDYYYEPSTWLFHEVPSDNILTTDTEVHLGETWYISYYLMPNTDKGSCALNRSMRHFTAYHDVFIIEYLTALGGEECKAWTKAAKYAEIEPGERAYVLSEVQYEYLEALRSEFESNVKLRNYPQQ